MDLHRKVKRVDEYINLIMSTHLQYMENRNKQTEDIKTINETLEHIAHEIKRHESSLTPPRFYDDEE